MKIGSPEWKEIIVDGARGLGIDVHPGQVDQFATHASTLKEWNQKINLTAIESPLDMAIKHCGKPDYVALQVWHASNTWGGKWMFR